MNSMVIFHSHVQLLESSLECENGVSPSAKRGTFHHHLRKPLKTLPQKNGIDNHLQVPKVTTWWIKHVQNEIWFLVQGIFLKLRQNYDSNEHRRKLSLIFFCSSREPTLQLCLPWIFMDL